MVVHARLFWIRNTPILFLYENIFNIFWIANIINIFAFENKNHHSLKLRGDVHRAIEASQANR